MVLSSALIAVLLQFPPTDPALDREKEPFQTLETRLSTAIKSKDAAALEGLLAKDFTFSVFVEGRGPQVLNRGEFVKTAEQHYTLIGFAILHLAARVFGDVAVVRLQPIRQATAGASLDRSGEFAVVDVWTKDGDAWKLSARYVSRPDTVKR